MAQIKAFRAIRPVRELSERVAALPYDVYSRVEAKAEVKREPYSFLKVDRAETQFEEEVDLYAPFVYQKAHDTLQQMIAEGILKKEETPCMYLYELTQNGRTQTGLVACVSVEDYRSGVIRKHENTRADKEEDRIRHVDICNAQTGPIFLAYRKNKKLSDLILEADKGQPIFDFTAPDGVGHRGWKIKDAKKLEQIKEAFEEVHRLYIADGHHRAASASVVAAKRSGEEAQYVLSVLFSEEQLRIMDYNRVVKDLNGFSAEDFLREVEKICYMEKGTAGEPVFPEKKGQMGLYLRKNWYLLTIREEFLSEDPIKGLDVSILQEQILSPLLGIKDPRMDGRIRFVGGIRGTGELMRLADETDGAAFSMYPTSMEELFAAADEGRLMPPKSTWFEPKLRSGLFIHELE